MHGDVHKCYGRHQVLAGADLSVEARQLVAVVGENGAGKSALLNGMKIAFVSKGGSGKTTLSALFARYLAASGAAAVVAIDADIKHHLGIALGDE